MKRKKSKDEEMCEAIAAALGAPPETLKPPKGWWREKAKKIREQHPDYSEYRVNAVVGAIWYKKYNKDKRECAVLEEALNYG